MINNTTVFLINIKIFFKTDKFDCLTLKSVSDCLTSENVFDYLILKICLMNLNMFVNLMLKTSLMNSF